MIYAVGQMSAGYSIDTVLVWLAQLKGDVARFCFERSVIPLRGQPAHHLLMAIAMFPKHALRKAVIHVVGLSADLMTAEEELSRLQQLSTNYIAGLCIRKAEYIEAHKWLDTSETLLKKAQLEERWQIRKRINTLLL